PQHWQAWAWGFSGGSTSGTPSAAHGRTTNNEAEILVLRGRRKPLRAAVRAGTQRRGRTTHPAGRGTGLPTLAAEKPRVCATHRAYRPRQKRDCPGGF